MRGSNEVSIVVCSLPHGCDEAVEIEEGGPLADPLLFLTVVGLAARSSQIQRRPDS